jgi:hypothetical protein
MNEQCISQINRQIETCRRIAESKEINRAGIVVRVRWSLDFII